jgi:hypothetical protein
MVLSNLLNLFEVSVEEVVSELPMEDDKFTEESLNLVEEYVMGDKDRTLWVGLLSFSGLPMRLIRTFINTGGRSSGLYLLVCTSCSREMASVKNRM